MIVSSKGRYALRVMIDLAQHDNGELISLKDIAKRQEISMKYLEIIVGILNRGGMTLDRVLKGRIPAEVSYGGVYGRFHPETDRKNAGSGELSGNRERLLRAGGKMHHSASLAEAGRDDRRVSGRDYP